MLAAATGTSPPVTRVDVPRAAVGLFSERGEAGAPPRAPLPAVATALGFAGEADLRAAVAAAWPSWRPCTSVSAAEFVALLQLLQFRSARAGRFLRDLLLGGLTRTVSLPTEPLPVPQEEASAPLSQEAASSADARSPRTESSSAAEAAVGESTASASTASDASPVSSAPSKGPAAAEQRSPLPPPWPMCDPEDVGMDRKCLDNCRRYLHYRIGRKHFNGIVGGVVKNGKLVYFDEAGHADIANKMPMRQDTLIRLFSMTKCIVVVAFLAYAEDPAYNIDLEDPVWKYIPSFKNVKLAAKRGSAKPRDLETALFQERGPDGKMTREKLPMGPTLRQLMTHTAGLGYGPTLGDGLPPKSTDHYRIYYDLLERSTNGQIKNLEEWVDELAKVPLKAAPGSYWEYSFATDVLGRVLEVVSGMPLDQAVHEKVCGPLGMLDTSFTVPVEKANRMGAWYEKKNPVDDKGNVVTKVPPGATWNLQVVDKAGVESGWVGEKCSKILSGGGTVEVPLAIKGGMVSTFRDYLRFLLMIRNMGELDGVRVLRRETVQTMLCNQIPAATGRRAAWVFNKKGQGFSFIGQIQVQHNEKDTFQEKGELKKSNTTLASLAPGTVSGEYGWGGLAGPAWTIDPRLDLIVLSISQTALELDHEENLRFSARRAIHAGIFGPSAGPMKVTDFPPEAHEGIRGSKLRVAVDRPGQDAELSAFLEAEQQALARGKTLKELAVGSGNLGHEVQDDEEADALMAGAAAPAAANAAEAAADPEVAARRGLERTPSASSAGNSGAGDAEPSETPPNTRKRAAPTGPAPPAARRRSASTGPAPMEAEEASASFTAPTPKQPLETAFAAQVAATPSPWKGQRSPALSPEELLFSRVCVKANGAEDGVVRKARVTAVEGNELEVVTEGSWEALNLKVGDVAVIDESCIGTSLSAETGPSDFGFLLAGGSAEEASRPARP